MHTEMFLSVVFLISANIFYYSVNPCVSVYAFKYEYRIRSKWSRVKDGQENSHSKLYQMIGNVDFLLFVSGHMSDLYYLIRTKITIVNTTMCAFRIKIVRCPCFATTYKIFNEMLVHSSV
jgi:hypothetical protein